MRHESIPRRRFLQLLALGGLATAAPATAAPDGDLDVVLLASSAEQLAVEAYARTLDARLFAGRALAYIEAAHRQEADHLRTLQAAARSLGGSVPPAPAFAFRAGTFRTPTEALRLLNALEDAFVGAYLGALPVLRDRGLVAAAGSILGVEAGHRVLVRETRLVLKDPAVTGEKVPNDRPYEKALTPAEAAAALAGFRPA